MGDIGRENHPVIPPVNPTSNPRVQPMQHNNMNNGINLVLMVDDRTRGIRDYVVPVFNNLNLVIARPHIEANHFELKPVMFQMLQTMGQFGVRLAESPYSHLKSFLEV